MAGESLSQLPSPISVLEEFAAAANRNRSVLEYRHANDFWSSCWTEEVIARRPPLRMEFEQAIVFGTISEALSIRRGKTSWGAFVLIEPLRESDFLHPCRVVYTLKPTNRMHQRWQFRRVLKHLLRRDRRLVNDAVGQTKSEFIRYLAPAEIDILCSRLELTPGEFRRMARFGERYGVDGAQRFVERLEESTKGYRLPFGPHKAACSHT